MELAKLNVTMVRLDDEHIEALAELPPETLFEGRTPLDMPPRVKDYSGPDYWSPHVEVESPTGECYFGAYDQDLDCWYILSEAAARRYLLDPRYLANRQEGGVLSAHKTLEVVKAALLEIAGGTLLDRIERAAAPILST